MKERYRMSRYNVLVYDKDNDLYETVLSTDSKETAYTVAQAVNKFVHQDRLLSMNNREPFDAVYIEDRMYDDLEYIEYKD